MTWEPKKTDNGWKVDIRPLANDRNFRKRGTFDTRAKALAFINAVKEKYKDTSDVEFERSERAEERTLKELVDTWWRIWGITKRDGKRTYNKLLAISEKMDNPIAKSITKRDFTDYIADRLEEEVAHATVNRDHSYLRAMFNKLSEKGYWDFGNPVEKIPQLEEIEAELTYYNNDELKVLFNHLNKSNSDSVAIVADICVSTGARWDEAESLPPWCIKNQAIQFRGRDTKTGKTKFVPISQRLSLKLKEHKPFSKDRMFSSCLSAFRRAMEKSKLPSPRGQLTHVLRHSFAVGFMENGGSITDLQKALGHANIETTMKYLRFAPDHLNAVPRLNPMDRMNQFGTNLGHFEYYKCWDDFGLIAKSLFLKGK